MLCANWVAWLLIILRKGYCCVSMKLGRDSHSTCGSSEHCLFCPLPSQEAAFHLSVSPFYINSAIWLQTLEVPAPSLGLWVCAPSLFSYSLDPPYHYNPIHSDGLADPGPFQMMLAFLSLVSTIKFFPLPITWSSHVFILFHQWMGQWTYDNSFWIAKIWQSSPGWPWTLNLPW